MKASVKLISELSGFSPATVSNALNNKKNVNFETAEKICRIAQEVGYHTSQKISQIKLVIFRKSGQIVSDTPFFAALINGVECQCRASGFRLVICNLHADDPDYQTQLMQILNDGDSAILLLATELEEEDAKVFSNATCPMVVLDNWLEGLNFDCVLMDNINSSYRAVEHLVACGHTKIGCLTSTIHINNFQQRELGYRAAIMENQLSLQKDYFVPLTPTMEGAYLDMVQFLKEQPDLPSAYFATNDIIALGAVKALKESGLRIPHDVSIIGFDDMPFCEIASPPLSTIRVFKQEMGEMAVRRLIDNIRATANAKTITQVGTTFIERKSVRHLEHKE